MIDIKKKNTVINKIVPDFMDTLYIKIIIYMQSVTIKTCMLSI